jgi:hypothetical protein
MCKSKSKGQGYGKPIAPDGGKPLPMTNKWDNLGVTKNTVTAKKTSIPDDKKYGMV